MLGFEIVGLTYISFSYPEIGYFLFGSGLIFSSPQILICWYYYIKFLLINQGEALYAIIFAENAYNHDKVVNVIKRSLYVIRQNRYVINPKEHTR